MCSSDNGGGYFIKEQERGIDRWYLFGIVSVGPLEDTTGTTCKNNTYTIYTDLSKHSDFIEDILYGYST